MKVEIKRSLKLTTTEKVEIAMHSLRNVLNVVCTELQFLQRVLKDKECLVDSLSLGREIVASFSDYQRAIDNAHRMGDVRKITMDDIQRAMETHTVDPAHKYLVEESLENLKNVFDVVEVRVREILARVGAPDRWENHSIPALEKDIRQVLDAMVQTSHGRYGVVYTREEQGAKDYWVTLEFKGRRGEMFFMPSVLWDCFRDLLANARKYTVPGGWIHARLVEEDHGLILEVSDSGRGIPDDEIETVVGFGVRGSNTLPEETQGGGYGLTKAYYVCQQLGGRMWIESELHRGTTVTMILPRPAATAHESDGGNG